MSTTFSYFTSYAEWPGNVSVEVLILTNPASVL